MFLILVSCNESKKETKEEKYLNASYKEQVSNGVLSKQTQSLDTLTNIYSNNVYLISMDAPDHWNIDYGTSKHSIFRGNDPELALTFSIVVVELKTNQNNSKNAWDFYLNNKKKQDDELERVVQSQFDTKLVNHQVKKNYIRNLVSVNHSYDFLVRSIDLEYVNHVIYHQINRGDFIYTLTAQMPKVVYEQQPKYFDNLFNLVTFLPDSEKIGD